MANEKDKMGLLAIWKDQRYSFNIVISRTQNEILKQSFARFGLEGAPKLLKAYFSRLFLCQNYETLEVPTRAVFRPLI